MRADLGAFFQDAYADLASGLGGKLLEADRRRQPRRAPADDDDVVGHDFALHEPFPRAFWHCTHYN